MKREGCGVYKAVVIFITLNCCPILGSTELRTLEHEEDISLLEEFLRAAAEDQDLWAAESEVSDPDSSYQEAISHVETLLGRSLETSLTFKDLNVPPTQEELHEMVSWWESVIGAPGRFRKARSCFSVFSAEEKKINSRAKKRAQLAYMRDKEVAFKQFAEVIENAHLIGGEFYRNNIITLKVRSFDVGLSVSDAGRIETNLYKHFGGYKAFNTFQYAIEEFVKWLVSKDQFAPMVYVYSTDSPFCNEYSKIKLIEKKKELKGIIYFIRDLNGWVPYYFSFALSSVKSPFMINFYLGNFETGQINRALIVKPGGEKDIIKDSGIYVQYNDIELGLLICLYDGVCADPRKSMRYRGVEIHIDSGAPLMEFLNDKLRETGPGGEESDESIACTRAHTAFFPLGSENHSNFLAYFVEYINMLQEGYTTREGFASPFLMEILAEYCQKEEPTKVKRKHRKRKKTGCAEDAKRGEFKEDDLPPDASAKTDAGTEPSSLEATPPVAEEDGRMTHAEGAHAAGTSRGTDKKLGREDRTEEPASESRTESDAVEAAQNFMIRLVQELIDTIPAGRMNNQTVKKLLNSWLTICQRECDLTIGTVTQKGNDITIHTNKGILNFAPKHGRGGDRKFSAGEARAKARELAELAVGK